MSQRDSKHVEVIPETLLILKMNGIITYVQKTGHSKIIDKRKNK